ncbi:hypothetical protein ACFL7M_07450 [Thermodesulfobacteriota bacterium]
MKKKRIAIIVISIGALFILNAILGRYIVLPGFLSYLEAKDTAAPLTPSVWGVVRYMIWAFSYKLGIFLLIIGASLYAGMSPKRFWLFIICGFLYVSLAYAPIPGPYSLLFGIGGVIITLSLLYIVWHWAGTRQNQQKPLRLISDFRMAGYFFLVMASYNLCPLTGISAFALTPEKMIRYGRESMAITLASHILIELVLGWFFLFLSHFKERSLFKEKKVLNGVQEK